MKSKTGKQGKNVEKRDQMKSWCILVFKGQIHRIA